MELNVGTNIKKLRLAKGLTQEQLAELLNVSSAAVSKWEAKNTYPDITMLFPLANTFEISVDELLGYDAAKTKEEIENLLKTYHRCKMNGEIAKARKIIHNARKTYPNDYSIMHTYMWDKAGGIAGGHPDLILKNQNEFTQICDCILDGCTEENLRLDALTMKAKLLHASGDTDGALKILEGFPSWQHSSAQKTEQLFAKDTPEYRYWIRKNAYGLMDLTANKLARMIWYDDALTVEVKIAQIEALGDMFSSMRKKKGTEFFAISEHMIYAELAGKLSSTGELSDIIRIREKQFDAIEALTKLSKSDEILMELITRTYKTENLLKWTIDWLMNTQHTQFKKLRDCSEYMDMLLKWDK